jgi:hypothetical protein
MARIVNIVLYGSGAASMICCTCFAVKNRGSRLTAEFFLKTCIDQVSFMESLMQPDRLRTRILLWAEEEIKLKNLRPRSGRVLEALLYRENCRVPTCPVPLAWLSAMPDALCPR